MLKFIAGPALVGAGYLTGSIYGADAEQLVHKSPSATYDGVSQAIGNIRSSGTTFFDGGTPVPYEIKVERDADKHLLVRLYFDGKPPPVPLVELHVGAGRSRVRARPGEPLS